MNAYHMLSVKVASYLQSQGQGRQQQSYNIYNDIGTVVKKWLYYFDGNTSETVKTANSHFLSSNR